MLGHLSSLLFFSFLFAVEPTDVKSKASELQPLASKCTMDATVRQYDNIYPLVPQKYTVWTGMSQPAVGLN